MFESRRQFLQSVANLGALLLHPLGIEPSAARWFESADSGARPVVERFLGQTILPGDSSTAVVVGSNLLSVESVVFSNRHLSTDVLERHPTCLVLRIRTSRRWREGAAEMQITTTTGRIVRVPVSFIAEQSRGQTTGRASYNAYYAGRASYYSAYRRYPGQRAAPPSRGRGRTGQDTSSLGRPSRSEDGPLDTMSWIGEQIL
jgi:hypothetical protein